MNFHFSSEILAKPDKRVYLLIGILFLLVCMTIVQDRLEANLRQSSFYFSESFLFSSFWWLFLPFLMVQFRVTRKSSLKIYHIPVVILIPVVLHLFTYPGLVWLISNLFYPHTFRYGQTFQYAVSQLLIPLFLMYTISVFLFPLFRKKTGTMKAQVADPEISIPPVYRSVMVVSEGNKRISIPVKDIEYFSANPPYIGIHFCGKRYLHNETLKSVSEKINPEEFIRIHKSTIVNIGQVHSYVSRFNGDYDLTLKSGISLRLSRNYASAFKSRFQNSHQDTTE